MSSSELTHFLVILALAASIFERHRGFTAGALTNVFAAFQPAVNAIEGWQDVWRTAERDLDGILARTFRQGMPWQDMVRGLLRMVAMRLEELGERGLEAEVRRVIVALG